MTISPLVLIKKTALIIPGLPVKGPFIPCFSNSRPRSQVLYSSSGHPWKIYVTMSSPNASGHPKVSHLIGLGPGLLTTMRKLGDLVSATIDSKLASVRETALTKRKVCSICTILCRCFGALSYSAWALLLLKFWVFLRMR